MAYMFYIILILRQELGCFGHLVYVFLRLKLFSASEADVGKLLGGFRLTGRVVDFYSEGMLLTSHQSSVRGLGGQSGECQNSI